LFFKGGVMILVIVISHKCKINPDNIATPIAASLGDLTTLAVLASIGGFLFKIIGENRIHSKFL
jgi:solute carrier family 41